MASEANDLWNGEGGAVSIVKAGVHLSGYRTRRAAGQSAPISRLIKLGNPLSQTVPRLLRSPRQPQHDLGLPLAADGSVAREGRHHLLVAEVLAPGFELLGGQAQGGGAVSRVTSQRW